MNLVKKILLGTALTASTLAGSAQTVKQAEKEFGTADATKMSWAHGYTMLKDGVRDAKIIQGLNDNTASIYYDGNSEKIEGIMKGVRESELEKLDLNKDYLISPEEIQAGYRPHRVKAMINYAAKTLDVKKSELEMLEGNYITTKNLKKLATSMAEFYSHKTGQSKSQFYETISSKDKVLSKKELVGAYRALKK